MNSLLRSASRLVVLLPAGMALIFFAILGTAILSLHQNKSQHAVLSMISMHDNAMRSAMTELSTASEEVNLRVLGAMAGIYSPAGVVQHIDKAYTAFDAAWQRFEAAVPSSDTESVQQFQKRVEEFRKQKDLLIKALRSAKKDDITSAYDTFIDSAVPLRKLISSSEKRLDETVTSRLSALSTDADAQNRYSLQISAIAILIAIATGTYALFGVARPIGAAATIIGDLQRNHLQTAIPKSRRSDEIGVIFGALTSFRGSLAEAESLRLAQLDASEANARSRKEFIDSMLNDLDMTVKEALAAISRTSTDLAETATTVSQLADRTLGEANGVADASATTSEGLQSAAAASDQLNVSIEAISRRVTTSALAASEASEKAGESATVLSDLGISISNIASALEQIRGIASQTNLLALNATIEAARAGDVGRGFAVVAGEVKQLASQTAQVTDAIGEHISAIRKAGDSVGAVMNSIASTVQAVNSMSSEISASINEQKSATAEIAERVTAASADAIRAQASIVKVNNAANSTGVQAKAVLNAVDALESQSDLLRRKIDQFISETRVG